jgi:hypothetical protein
MTPDAPIHDQAAIRNSFDEDEVTRIVHRVGAALNSGTDRAVVQVVLDEVAKAHEQGARVVPGPHIPIPAPDYTMRTGHGHAPLPDRNSTPLNLRAEVEALRARLKNAEAALDLARMERAEAEDAETAADAEVDKWRTAAHEFEASYVTTHDTLTKRSAAHDRLVATVGRVRDLLDGAPMVPQALVRRALDAPTEDTP